MQYRVLCPVISNVSALHSFYSFSSAAFIHPLHFSSPIHCSYFEIFGRLPRLSPPISAENAGVGPTTVSANLPFSLVFLVFLPPPFLSCRSRPIGSPPAARIGVDERSGECGGPSSPPAPHPQQPAQGRAAANPKHANPRGPSMEGAPRFEKKDHEPGWTPTGAATLRSTAGDEEGTGRALGIAKFQV